MLLSNRQSLQVKKEFVVFPVPLKFTQSFKGRINLSNRSLTTIPEEVWKMYEVDPTSITVDFSSSASEVWYEAVDLTRMIVADNQLQYVDKRIADFSALVFLDVRIASTKVM